MTGDSTTEQRSDAASPSGDVRREEVLLHGHRVSYLTAGSGPLLLLMHGITQSAEAWREVIPRLATRFEVLAPDLLGHGQSAKPVGDYSMGAYASAVRDLFPVLRHRSATVVGHSLGGGVAMQFAYQFPQRTERLVLVSSGGLGRELHPTIRAATLPGAEPVLRLLAGARLRSTVEFVGRLLHRFGVEAGPDIAESWKGFTSLADDDARQAFLTTLRTSVGPRGQRVSATDRLYLASELPTMIVWGERDPIIPVEHGRSAASAIPGSRFEVFAEAGHFPHLADPARFAALLISFIDETDPSDADDDTWEQVLREHAQTATGATRSTDPV